MDNLKRYFINYDKFDYIILIFLISIHILVFFTKIVNPFNQKFHYSAEARTYLEIKYSSILYTVIFSLILASIYIIWTIHSIDKIRLIIPLSGFSLRIIGSISQNSIYGSDAINHLGIINRMLNNTSVSQWNENYPGFFFHRLVILFTFIFNLSVEQVLLYIIPVVIFLLYVPLGDKVISLMKTNKEKLATGYLYYLFPFVFALKYNITPYSMLIGIFSLYLFILPLNTKKKLLYGYLLAIIGFLIHIHGVLLVIIIIGKTISYSMKNIEAKIKIEMYFFYFLVIIYLSLIAIYNSQFDIIHNFIVQNSFAKFSISKLLSTDGELMKLFIPKIHAGGLFRYWYLIQLFIFTGLCFICFYWIYKVFVRKTTKIGVTLALWIQFLFQSLTILTLSLVYGWGTQLWRINYFTTLISPFVLISTFKRKINNSNDKIFYLGIFMMLFFSPYVIYYQLDVIDDNQISAALWIDEEYKHQETPIVTFSDLEFSKIAYAYVENVNPIIWKGFWKSNNLSDYLNSNWAFRSFEKPYSMLLVISTESVAWELQFENVLIWDKISEIDNLSPILVWHKNNIWVYELSIL